MSDIDDDNGSAAASPGRDEGDQATPSGEKERDTGDPDSVPTDHDQGDLDASGDENASANQVASGKEDYKQDEDEESEFDSDLMMSVCFQSGEVPVNDLTNKHRIAFNVQAFGYDKDKQCFPKPSFSSKQFSDERYTELTEFLQEWNDANQSYREKGNERERIVQLIYPGQQVFVQGDSAP
jgi:hypothetical protein